MRPEPHLGVGDGYKDLAVQQLIAQLAVEALGEPVLPRAAWVNVMRRTAAFGKPSLHLGGDELPRRR